MGTTYWGKEHSLKTDMKGASIALKAKQTTTKDLKLDLISKFQNNHHVKQRVHLANTKAFSLAEFRSSRARS